MKRIHIITGLTLALAISAHGQVSNPSIITVASDPTGVACTSGVPMEYFSGVYYGCDNAGHYAAIASGGTITPESYGAKGDGKIAWSGSMTASVPTPSTGNSATASSPSFTTNFANETVVSAFFNFFSTWGSPSAGITRVNVAGISTTSGVLVSDQSVSSAGVVPAVTSSLSGTQYWYGATIPLVPKPGTSITFVAEAHKAQASGASLVINQPAGTSAGDVQVACLSWYSPANSITASPSAFPLNFSVPVSVAYAGGNHPIWCWTRIATASDPSSYTWTQSQTSYALVGFIVDYQNVAAIDSPITQSVWPATTALTKGNQIVDPNGDLEEITTAGTTGSSAPTWPTSAGSTTSDGTATWTNKGIAPVWTASDVGKLLCVNGSQSANYGNPGCGYVGYFVSSSEILPIGFANGSGSAINYQELRYATDDSSALQDAINSAPGTISLAKAKYGVSRSLIFPTNTPFVLEGVSAGVPSDYNFASDPISTSFNNPEGSSLWFMTYGLSSGALQLGKTNIQSDGNASQVIRDLSMYAGVGKTYNGGGSDAVDVFNWGGLKMSNVSIANFFGEGVYIDSQSGANYYTTNNTMDQMYVVWSGKNGVRVGGTGSYLTTTTIRNSNIGGNKLAGIELQTGTQGAVIQGNNVVDNNVGGTAGITEIHFTGTPLDVVINGNYIEPRCNGGLSFGYINTVSSLAGSSAIGPNYYSQVCTSSYAAPSLIFAASGVALPAAGIQNAHGLACVSDSTACTAGTNYTSGGTTKCLAQSDGTNWIETGAGCY